MPTPPTMLLTMLEHMAWADARTHAAVAALPEGSAERARATRLYAHLAAAEHVWLSRLEGRAPEHPVWPELSLADAGALAERCVDGLRAVAARGADELARGVAYRNSAGQAFRDTAADILCQVVLHGSYHRGQIAQLVRQGGGEPAHTDYIVHRRGVPVPPAGGSRG
jgi:uncharacterized damage-inducible protein DinB